MVAKCDWGRNPVVSGRARPKMHSDVVASVAGSVGQQPAVAAAAPEVTAGKFKKAVKTAVLHSAMTQLKSKHASPAGKSTVANYLRILGPTVTSFPNALPEYLHAPMTRGTQLKLLFRAGFAPTARTSSKKHGTSPACPICEHCSNETAVHFALECHAFRDQRQQFFSAVQALVGPASFQAWMQLGGDDRLNALLGDQWWGPHAAAGDELLQNYLLQLEAVRAHLSSSLCTLPAGAGARAHGSGCG